MYFPFPFLLCANTRKNTRAYPFAMFDCYRHFSFLHPIQFHTVERTATKSMPHIKRLTDVEAIPFPTSSHFQLTAKFDSPASQNDVKACSKVMYLIAPKWCRFQLTGHWGFATVSLWQITHFNLRQWPASCILKLTHFLLPLIKTTVFSFL